MRRPPEYIPLSICFALFPHKPTVCARIAKLNPLGLERGAIVRGWHPKPSAGRDFTLDVVSVATYRRKWGCDSVRITYQRGRHKFVSKRDYIMGPQD